MNKVHASGTIATRRRGSAALVLVLVIVAVALGAVGGYLSAGRFATGSPSAPADAAAAKEQLYTCGMHPNVLQPEPGDCPICQMKLTPRKDSDEGDDAGRSNERKILYWRAPMDPNFVSDKPGQSPMGMDLVPVYADQAQSTAAHTIRIDPVTVQNMGIRTEVIRRGPLVKTTRTLGRVDYDEQRVTFVDTKFNGWIETLHVDETGQSVEVGQPLFDVYSPELYAAQEEYLAAVRTLPRMENSSFAVAREEAIKLAEAAETKLRYMDVSDPQIARLRDTGKIEKTITIHSPATGIVTEKMALEGMYVKPGMRLFTMADLSRVWVYVDIYEYQLPWIRVGQSATMTLAYIPGKQFVGTAVYIYPYLEKRTRVIKVRLEFENPTLELKPGMFANVRLESELQRDAVLIPREAYIDSGTRQVAFIDAGNGKFVARDIHVGVEAESGMVEVLYGIDEGEVVVTSGQFMLDAESKLKEAVAKMMKADRAQTTKRALPSGASASTETVTAVMPPDTAYTCPMEQHPDEEDPGKQGPYFSAQPGECPWCGMNLKPIEQYAWVEKYRAGSDGAPVTREDPAGVPADAKYACPMDTHPAETDPEKQGAYFSSEEGRCPWCNMAIKPLDQLEWVKLRRAAHGGDVAYTCPDHPHVFSDTSDECPRCAKRLMPFKVMYACPDTQHAGIISTHAGNCPRCGRGMAAYRGVWLDDTMAQDNTPPTSSVAESAPFQCPAHPVVHSHTPGQCTICARPLEAVETTAQADDRPIPGDATHTCPMMECWHFDTQPGDCPACGMKIKPIDEVAWVKKMQAAKGQGGPAHYVCPMHPTQTRRSKAGVCPICGMKLVREATFQAPQDDAQNIAAQMDYILEHYLELQQRLASDRTRDVARHALGLAAASDQLKRHLSSPNVHFSAAIHEAARNLHAAALKTTGSNLDADRVTLVELSASVRTLIETFRPDRTRWPELFIYHCPMSKGDWIQASEQKANPYYGFKMLKCGQLKETR